MPYDPQRDPYAFYTNTPLNPARRAVPVTPGANDFEKYPKALSIWVPDTVTNASFTVTPSRDADNVLIKIALPHGRTTWDQFQVRRFASVSDPAIDVLALYDM